MSLPRFTSRQLEAFEAVAEMRSFTDAADRLALSPSAVSQLINELESTLDFKLFDRSTRRVEISSAGREFLASADSVLKHLRLAQSAAEDVRNRAAGIVRIAAPLVVASVILPPVIKAYSATRPKVRVHIRDVPVDRLVVFAAPDHPLVSLPKVSMAQLLQQPWIVREKGSGTRETFDRAFKNSHAQLHIRLELEHTEAIKRAVESGLGIGCISRLALKDAFKRGSLIPLEIAGLDLKRQFNFVLHKQKFITTGINRFLELCRQVTQGASRSDLIVMRKPDGAPVEYK